MAKKISKKKSEELSETIWDEYNRFICDAGSASYSLNQTREDWIKVLNRIIKDLEERKGTPDDQ